MELTATGAMTGSHVDEIRPRKDHRGVDLISDALPFGGPERFRFLNAE